MNSRAKGTMELLDKYTTGATETDHTFTFPAETFDKTSELVLIMDGAATGALAVEIRINGLSTNQYFYDGSYIIAGAETLINGDSQDEWQVASASIITGANFVIKGQVHISLFLAGTFDRPSMTSHFQSDGNQTMGGSFAVAQTSITSVTVQVSTSSFIIGTRMSLYRIRR